MGMAATKVRLMLPLHWRRLTLQTTGLPPPPPPMETGVLLLRPEPTLRTTPQPPQRMMPMLPRPCHRQSQMLPLLVLVLLVPGLELQWKG